VNGGDGYFDERVAAGYDESDAEMFAPEAVEPVVDFLASRAGSGRALELGIGTGRIALPLAARGVAVHGIELSRAMAERLRAKPGGDDIGVTIGDFATTRVDGTFTLAYLVYNTIMNLTTQAAQVACFRNVAAHLEPGGCFVIEVGVPALQRLPAGEIFHVFHAGEDSWGIDEYEVASGAHVAPPRGRRRPARADLDPVPIRVALGARPDGRARRHVASRAMERVEIGAVHERQPAARVGLGEAGGLIGAVRKVRRGAGRPAPTSSSRAWHGGGVRRGGSPCRRRRAASRRRLARTWARRRRPG
jgi:SAM-dependent methyltransferase